MKKLVLALLVTTACAAQAQGFFKKPVPAESPAAAASKPAAPAAAPTPAPAPKPAPVQAVAPAPAVEPPKAKPAPTPKPRVQQQPRVAAPKPSRETQAVERPAVQPIPSPAPAPAQDAAALAAAKGMVDPVAECAGGWGIKQAFCRSLQCQRSESFHHPVCVDMRAEQAARQQPQMMGEAN